MRKKIAYIPLIALCLFLLSGCFKIEGAVTVDGPSNTVSGEATLFYPKAVWSKMDDQKRREFLETPVPEVIKAKPFQEAGGGGMRYTFDKTPLTTFVKTAGMEKFPVYMSRDTRGVYTIKGNFRPLLLGPSKLQAEGIDVSEKNYPTPEVSLKIALPVALADVPEGVTVEANNTIVITGDFVRSNPEFTLKSQPYSIPKGSEETPDGEATLTEDTNIYKNFAKAAPEETVSYYPLIKAERSSVPVYIFAALIFGGIGLCLYGHFGNLSWISARSRAAKEAAPKAGKKEKKPKAKRKKK